MRIPRTARLLAAAGAAVLGLGLMAEGTAQAVTATTVDSVTYSASAVDVSGLALKPLTVSAHITTTAVPHQFQFVLGASPHSGAVTDIEVIAQQSSGPLGDGVWTATVQIPSTAGGTWFLAAVNDCTAVSPTRACTWHDQTPGASPAPEVTVTGHHQPIVTWGQHPRPVAYPQVAGIVSGHVIDGDTGLGMAGVSVGFNSSSGLAGWCTSGTFQVRHTTDATGAFSFSTRHLAGLHHCMGVGTAVFASDGSPTMPWFRQFEALTLAHITVTPLASRAKVGSALRLNGTYADAGGILAGPGKAVHIEQLHGRSTWIPVASAPVRASGRWSTTIRPTLKGRNVYRVRYSGNFLGGWPSSTKPFVIRGT